MDRDIDRIFAEARGIESERERTAYLDGLGHPELRRQIEKLLAADANAGGFMRDTDSESEQPASAESGVEEPGKRIGPFELMRVIGDGGMGTVYRAEQTEPVKRTVALKIIKPGMDSGEIIARFDAERQALALMDHPNIARVLDAGATDADRPYFVMELVEGSTPITDYCDHHRFDPRQRLELFLQVCEAVHHAHQRGIIHRDLKPSNVLVAEYDGEPVPKVIDFGVAKATGQRLTEKTLVTEYGQVVGTLEYMSPEQAKFRLDIDVRSDVYALGVLLYELLTGTTPFGREHLPTDSFVEILRIIGDEEPPKPSTRISTLGGKAAAIAAHRDSEPAKLKRLVSGELDWIAMRCLEKERDRRYESAGSLAADVGRFLNHETVLACPPSRGYRLKKFVRRHRGPVVAGAALLLMLILGLFGTSAELFRARAAERQAVRVNFRMALDKGLVLCDEGHVAHGMLWLARALELCPPDDAAHRRLILTNLNAWRREAHTLQAVLPHDEAVIGAAFDPRGDRLATASNDDTARIWDLRTGRPIGGPLKHSGDAHEVVFSSDGSLLLSSDYGSTAFLWNTKTGERIHKFQLRAGLVPGATFRPPHDRQVVTSDGAGEVRIWDVETGKEVGALKKQGNLVHDVVVSADGERILTACHDKNVRVWDFESRRLLAVLQHEARVPTADFGGANDELVVSGDAAGNIHIWRLAKALSGKTEVKTLSVAAGDCVTVPGRHRGVVHRVRVGPKGRMALSASFDNTVRMWDLDTGTEAGSPFEHEAPAETALFNSDGSLVVTACDDDTARVWRPAIGPSVRLVEHPVHEEQEAVYSADGLYVLAKVDKQTMHLRDVATGDKVCGFAHAGGLWTATVQADGSRLLVSGADQKGRLYDIATGEPVIKPIEHSSLVMTADLSRSGEYTLTGDWYGAVQVRDARDGRRVQQHELGCRIWSARFNIDATRFAVGGTDRLVRVFDRKTGTQRLRLAGHLSTVTAVAFSRDGKRIVTGSHDNTARVWDAATGEPLSDPMPLAGPVWYPVAVGFSPDGRTIVTGSDRVAQIWDIATAKQIGPALRHESDVRMVAFTGDARIRTGTSTGTASIWDTTLSPLEDSVERVNLWVQVCTGLELDTDDELRSFDAETWNRRRARLEELGGASRAR